MGRPSYRESIENFGRNRCSNEQENTNCLNGICVILHIRKDVIHFKYQRNDSSFVDTSTAATALDRLFSHVAE